MTVTVKIDNSTARGKALIKELQRYPKTVTFENPAETGIVPEGYMTSKDFWKLQEEKTKQFCKANGIL